MASRVPFAAAVLLTIGPWAAAAHAAPGMDVDWLWGGGFYLGLPTGEFDRAVDDGYGLAGHFTALPHGRPFGLRGEVSALVYGSRSFDSQPYGGQAGATVRTDTWFGNMLVGPELRARSGTLRPYLHALAGVGYFATSSEQSIYYETVPVSGTTRFEDAAFAWTVGGGVELAVGSSLAIDLGARYLANGTVDYFTQGQLGSGSGALPGPHRSEAHLFTFTVGIAFGR